MIICIDCRHWETIEENTHRGICSLSVTNDREEMLHPTSLMAAETYQGFGGARLNTSATFGCVQGAAK